MTSPSLTSMLEARSVAVVGASSRPGSFGDQMMIELERGGYEGEVFPINPRYGEVRGRRCFSALDDIGTKVDLVLLGVANARIEEQTRAAADAGARAAVIFSSCYEEPAPGRERLDRRLAALADEAGMAVCGGNCMGFLNIERGLRACGFSMPADLEPGPITFISHSGSAFAALAHNNRELRFNLIVSAGQEFNVTTADYLDYSLGLDSTKVVGIFLETVRDPARFRAALDRAATRDIPIVILKVGREDRARALVAAHSGALAGDDAAYDALFDAHGVIRVRTLDEMADTLEIFQTGSRAAPGGLAAIHDSGGERAMLIDVAASAGVEFAEIGGKTRSRLAEVLEEGLTPANPLDAWGTGNDAETIYTHCIDALLDDPAVGALAFCVDLTTEAEGTDSYVSIARSVHARARKPVAVLANLTSAIDRRDVKELRGAGIPVLEGTWTGLAALGHLLRYREMQTRPPMATPAGDPAVRARWRERLGGSSPLAENEALQMLEEYGVPVVRRIEAGSLDAALSAADAVGYPVALKTAASGVAHKTEAGGVILGIAGPSELRTAYADLEAALGSRVAVAPMVLDGVEMALGIVHDLQFGPMVMVGAGGVLIEVLDDKAFSLAPIDGGRARTMIDSLRVRRLLDGVRGAPLADVDSLERCLVALGVLAADAGDLIAALDVNPVIVGPDGCIAVDALVLSAETTTGPGAASR